MKMTSLSLIPGFIAKSLLFRIKHTIARENVTLHWPSRKTGNEELKIHFIKPDVVSQLPPAKSQLPAGQENRAAALGKSGKYIVFNAWHASRYLLSKD